MTRRPAAAVVAIVCWMYVASSVIRLVRLTNAVTSTPSSWGAVTLSWVDVTLVAGAAVVGLVASVLAIPFRGRRADDWLDRYR